MSDSCTFDFKQNTSIAASFEGQLASQYSNWVKGEVLAYADFIAFTMFKGGMEVEAAKDLRTALESGAFSVSDLFLAAQSKAGISDPAGTPKPVLHVDGFDPIDLSDFMSEGPGSLATWTSGNGKNVITHTREFLNTFNGGTADANWDAPPAPLHVNDAPVAAADFTTTATESQDGTIGSDIVTVDLLGGAIDPEGGPMTVTIDANSLPEWMTLDVNGHTLQIDQNSRALDHLKEGELDSVTINYTLTDEHGAEVNTHVTVKLTGTNDLPVATPILATATETVSPNAGSDLKTVDLLAGATDADGDALHVVQGSLSMVGGSLPEWASLDAAGNLVIDQNSTALNFLAEAEHKTFTFNFQVNDGHGNVANSVTVDVVGTNDLPTAAALNVSATETQSIYDDAHQIINLGADIIEVDLLSGANDVDGDALSVVQGSINFGGSLPAWASLDADGHTLLIDQNARSLDFLKDGEHESFTFDYKLTDGIAQIGNSVTVDLTGTKDQHHDGVANGMVSGTWTKADGNQTGNDHQTLSFHLPDDGGFDYHFSGTLTATGHNLTGNERSTISDFNSDDGFTSLVVDGDNLVDSAALSNAGLSDHGVTFNISWNGQADQTDGVTVGVNYHADYWLWS